jgi:hypothetical protein
VGAESWISVIGIGRGDRFGGWDLVGGTVCDVKRSYWQFFEWPALVPGDSAAR